MRVRTCPANCTGNLAQVAQNSKKHQRHRAGLGPWVLGMWSQQVWGWAGLFPCEAPSFEVLLAPLTAFAMQHAS